MTQYKTNKYRIGIYEDRTFKEGSADNSNQYDFVYFEKSEYRLTSVFGIKIYQDDTLINSAIIGAIGGGTCIHDTSTIIEHDRLVICCSDSIFCLSIPDLTLLWRTQADQATCFEIFKYQDSYIIHGELEISRLDKDGKILWQQGGADIFTTLNGNSSLIITDHYILATDFENRKYKFDFNGNILKNKIQMTDQSIKKLINAAAIITMLAGLFGMLFCAPYLWSRRMENLVGAGFHFVGGSILFGTGLLTLGLFNKPTNK